MLHFLEYLEHLPVIPYHSVQIMTLSMLSFFAQLMIRKKYLTNIKILYVSFKKRSVINFNHTGNSQDKNAINEVTSKSLGVQETKSVMQFVIVLFNSKWYYSCKGNNESHPTWHYTWQWFDMIKKRTETLKISRRSNYVDLLLPSI